MILSKTKKLYKDTNIKLALSALQKCIIHLKKTSPKKKKYIKNEIKINLDYQLNEIIIKTLNKSNLPIISEENSTYEDNKFINTKKNYWIIDPLDGSLNYLRNIPYSAICMSLVINKNLSFSLIYDIFKKDLYIANKNKILVNGRIFKSERKFAIKKKSILATGFPHKFDFKSQRVNYKEFHKIRMIGCASLSLLGCLTGHFDWYHEKNIMIWDIAAGYHFNKINKCKVKKFKLSKLCQEVSLGYSN